MKKLRRRHKQPHLPKTKCEICNLKEPNALEVHHIIPQCDSRSHNNNSNLAIICGSCHNRTHKGDIIIIGVYDTSAGRKLMFFNKGEEPPFPKELWLIKENPLVVVHK